MLVDIVLGILGLISIAYIIVLYFSTVAKEKEKVDSVSLETSNDHYWASLNAHGSTLRQRPTHSYDDNVDDINPHLPRPIPPGRTTLAGPPPIVANDTPLNMFTVSPGINQLHHRKSDPPPLEPRPVSPPRVHMYTPAGIPPPQALSHSDSSHTAASNTKPNQAGLRGSVPLFTFHTASSTHSGSSSDTGRHVALESLYPPPPLPPGVERQPAEHNRDRRTLSFDMTHTSNSSNSSRPSPEVHLRKHLHQSAACPIPQQQQLRHRTTPDRDFLGGTVSVATGGGVTDSAVSVHSARSFHDAPYAAIKMTDMTLLHVIGGGAFGQVWKATWKGTPVAVKVLSSQIRASEEELQVFTDEVQMLACLRHPNICLFLGACLKPPNRYIVTELVSRGSLWEALRTPHLFNEVGLCTCHSLSVICAGHLHRYYFSLRPY